MSNDDVLAAQIKSSIITKIKTQEYLPGELLPSERDFATMYSVSRYLIHDIFDELISQHYLIRVQGKGTFVRKPEQNRVALGVLNESKNKIYLVLALLSYRTASTLHPLPSLCFSFHAYLFLNTPFL